MSEQTKKVAIVTYNRVGEGQYPNGVVKGENIEIYFAQNGHKSKWTASSECSDEIKERARRNTARAVTDSVGLKEMNHTFLYVGNSGGEEAIRLTAELPSEKITYVMCGCNSSYKMSLIYSCGRVNPNVIGCECGGRETLEDIATELLSGRRTI